MSESILAALQQDLAARLTACDYFADLPVLTERRGEILSGIERALGAITLKDGKTGACVLLLQPVATVISPNLSSPLLKADLTIRVLENVVVNNSPQGTGKPALSIATALLNHLHHYQPAGLAQTLTAESPSIVPVKDPAAPVAYDVRFSAQVADTEILLKVATPVIVPFSGTVPLVVAISCGTPGATLHFTTGGPPPYPGQSGVQTFLGPFLISSPTVLRVAALRPGFIPSDTAYARYE